MKNNLIFLDNNDLDKSVYRIFSFTRLQEIFNTSQLTLVKPKLWDDPFENYILSSKGTLKDGSDFQINFRDHYYRQCWSLTKESDAMWRIYSPNKDGVKVRTTIRKLFQPLFALGEQHKTITEDAYSLSSFVGRVKYAGTKELVDMLNDEQRMTNKIFDQFGWGQASTFFFKRVAFKHEREVRLIHNSSTNPTDTFKFTINPVDTFDEIVFDPRMKESVYLNCKDQLLTLGYTKKVIQSGLYKVRDFKITLNIPT